MVTSPADRIMVNVGTIPEPPSPPSSQDGDGQAHRRLLASGWGGVLVVVRAWKATYMAKEDSRLAVLGRQDPEVAGEYRRTVPRLR
ncbi:MAG: hypothetical protein M3198_01670 [Actinomycetota bacterium]|nr:hypothetical protein [Actinomycetota bacterium]